MILNLLLTSIIIVSGWASQYAPGVMERVIATRQAGRTAHDLPQDLPAVNGYVAMVNCDQIGEVIYARPLGQDYWETFLVVDCSGHSTTTNWMTRNNILVEVDYETAVRWDTVGRGKRIEMRTYGED